ncbi:hypothetical protein RHCRD62_100227 [Rhodococcus sp. RD6.2]|nr:hypothetical protein RHCRD62_100227 [Rhodococcus sp. RD6.2]
MSHRDGFELPTRDGFELFCGSRVPSVAARNGLRLDPQVC